MADTFYKACSKCKQEKPSSEFARCTGGIDGLRAHCRQCYNERRKQYYWSVRDRKLQIRREYENRPEVIAKRRAVRSLPEVRAKEREAVKKYRARPDVAIRNREYRRKLNSQPDTRAKLLFQATRLRAAKQLIPFSLTEEWVIRKVAEGRCEITGLEFDFGRPGKTRRNPFCPSIDQIRPGEGYTMENSRVVLTAVNLALCDWGLDQFLYLARHALIRNGYQVHEPSSKAA